MPDRAGRLRVIVLVYLVRCPLGGMAWHHLQYAMGLARLGHDVTVVEDSDDVPWCCYDPRRDANGPDPAYGLRFAQRVLDRVGLGDRWAYHDAHTGRWLGPVAGRALAACAAADLLLNLSGANPVRPWLADVPVRVYVDTDPAFTQIRHLTEPDRRERALAHTAFFSFGENIAAGSAAVPDDGLAWRPTRQPVVLDAWPVAPPPPPGARFTTVMHWSSYPARRHGGVDYGMKSDAFGAFVDLPAVAGRRFEVALGGAGAPRPALAAAGWVVRDPFGPSRDPWTYQRYIRSSYAEFSVAKSGYITSRSGWFSERSTGYLASGRPALVQDTGFTRWLPSGLGVVAVGTFDDALAGAADIAARYAEHSRAARDLIAEYFDAKVVLPRLLDAAAAADAAAAG